MSISNWVDNYLKQYSVTVGAAHLSDHLSHISETPFPMVNPERGTFSFNNGIYDAKTNQFLHIDSTEYAQLSDEYCTSLYLDCDWNVAVDNGRAVNVECVQRILDAQTFDVETQRVFWICIGYLLHSNDANRFTMVPAILGRRGSGAAFILQLIYGLAANERRRRFRGKMPLSFGLQDVFDMDMCFLTEVDRLPDDSFAHEMCKAIAAKDPISVAVKFRRPKTGKVDASFIVAGNSLPRSFYSHIDPKVKLMIFEFKHCPPPLNYQAITNELRASFLQKANLAYLEFCDQVNMRCAEEGTANHQGLNIFDFVPASFRETEERHIGAR
jgi:hypothetical protein